MNSTDEKKRKHSTATVIILCVFTASVIYLITAALNKSIEPNATPALYAEELKDITTKHQKCLERADPGFDPTVHDPMEGTVNSRESIAQTERDTCNRQYKNQLRILKSKYE